MKKVAQLAMLAALAIALRLVLVELPNVKPLTAIFLVVALVYGLRDSLAVMSVTMLVSALWLGMSLIVVGQIVVYAVIISIFWTLARRWRIEWQALFSTFLVFIYGALIDGVSGWLYGFGAGGYIAYWSFGLSFDVAHAVSTLLFFPIILVIFKKILRKE